MNNALETAKNLLAKWKEKNPKLSQKWSKRRSAVIESWESKCPELLESILKSCHAVQNVTFCQLCTDADALIRCYDCCQKIHLRIDCDKSIHKENPLHDRQAMINGFYQNIPPTVAFNSTCTNFINIERTFPGTNIACAVGIINKVTFATSFKEWKFCQLELDNICLCDWMKCPGCSEQQHFVHVDGNMKLYRFKTAGMSPLKTTCVARRTGGQQATNFTKRKECCGDKP
ncbi:hypothetical protein AC249_AIPGENE287 [Exaiptasia diaphana]|nr:hypothetical protein AC249_AIPGENE287 [Exaiptasia diaphana]